MATKKRKSKASTSQPASPTAVFDIVNERIDALLAQGTIPWRKPWTGRPSTDGPRNVEGRPYSGINLWTLGALGYADPRFLTYKKATALGGHVRKGEQGAPVVFWKRLTITETDEATGQKKRKTIPMLRYFTVFNVEQCEGLKLKPIVVPVQPTPGEAEAAMLDMVASWPDAPRLTYDGGDRAYYQPHRDHIHLPTRDSFKSPEGFAETFLHEHVHSTGHETRLDRFARGGEPQHFGSERYAREELVAEMGAAYLMAEAGMASDATLDQHAAYIANWRAAIKDDPRALVVAAGKADKAARLILGTLVAEEAPEAQVEAAAA